MTAVLTCRAVSARYGPIEICRGIDLQAVAGKVLVITGPNGAGKTTLLRRIAGHCAGSGEILLQDQEVGRLPAHARTRLGILSVPESRGLLSELSVAENVQLATLLLPRAERAAALRRAVERFPIVSDRASAPAGALSGGEQQMVALARILLLRPTVVLLDEPSQGLAPTIVGEVGEVIGELRDQGVAVVLVEQHLGLAASVADSVAVLIGGEIAMTRHGTSLLDEELLADAYLGAGVAGSTSAGPAST